MDKRIRRLAHVMQEQYGVRPTHIISAPGRVELGGNHTDHNRGNVLAASVDLDMTAVTAPLSAPFLTVYSEQHGENQIDLSTLTPVPAEAGTSRALMRGMARFLTEAGLDTGGLLIVMDSHVLPGSGLSSSAAFEMLIGGAFSAVYNGGSVSPVVLAKAGQQAENLDFGKPSGLMDQLASAVGGVISIDFAGAEPVIRSLAFDLETAGYQLVVVNTRSSHADLTPAYAAIPAEMREIAAFFGEDNLQTVQPSAFYAAIAELRALGNDRAVLRAMHFFAETKRVPAMLDALSRHDMKRYFDLVKRSGLSSALWLQNTRREGEPATQPIQLALALSEHFLAGDGAARIQGGGFAGTIQAYVPLNRSDDYMAFMNDVFGDKSCTAVRFRQTGLVTGQFTGT